MCAICVFSPAVEKAMLVSLFQRFCLTRHWALSDGYNPRADLNTRKSESGGQSKNNEARQCADSRTESLMGALEQCLRTAGRQTHQEIWH